MWSVKLAAIAGVASKLVCNVQKLYATPDKNISVSIRATVRANPRVRRTNTGIRARNVALRRSIYAVFIFPNPHWEEKICSYT